MKMFIPSFLLVVALVATTSAHAYDDKFINAMQKNIDALYKADSIDQFQSVVNTLERIGAAEKTKWEPYYYAAFGYIMMAVRENDGVKKDGDLDLAQAAITKADALLPNDSEITALQGFIHMIRLTVDPATRGPKYVGLAMQTFGKANALNPENPRALILMAQMQLGTAQFFKSPTTEACATMQRAAEKFDTYKSSNPIAPVWGKSMVEGMKGECK
jgi:tetratricopeptide (TPR) repeat protein